jgi:hypothetical protein
MTAMISSDLAGRFPAAGFEPVGGDEGRDFADLHCGQAGQHIFEVLPGVDTEATTVLDNGVEDGGFLPGLFAPYEKPIFGAKFRWANGVLDEIIDRLRGWAIV